jgi:hypothetical protein
MKGGVMPQEGINPANLPEAVEHVWHWFLQLNAKRPQGMCGICPIPESEIHFFFLNRQISPQMWEVDAIAALDAVAITTAQRK